MRDASGRFGSTNLIQSGMASNSTREQSQVNLTNFDQKHGMPNKHTIYESGSMA